MKSIKLLLIFLPYLNAQFPSLQLESKLTHLTNILQDRDHQPLYDHNLPQNEFKGNPLKPSAKLIDGIIPIHYTLHIRPILQNSSEQFTAPGTVKILFKCQQPTDTVIVHAVEIQILDQIEIQNVNKLEEVYPIKRGEISANESVYRIHLVTALEAEQEYQLTISFVSLVSKERLSGLYLSNYTDPVTKEIKFMALTQFESINARQAFPCFDEPHLKATFDVSVGRQLTYNTISNMNLISTEPIAGLKDWVWDHYNTSVRMSTYLVAFIVSDYTSEMADPNIFGGKPVRTWAPKHAIEAKDGVYASQVAAKVLNFYENYFQMSYPLPKMDLVAIHFFSAGAMENWGLNTYREKLLLHFGNETTESERYSITSVVSHELAHQNFGNMVTCKMWNHLWLNEGFATYVSFLGVNEVAPEFKPFDLFYTEVTQSALKSDSVGTHPLVNETDILSTGYFDKITYKKGASLIKMMEGFLGQSTLHLALQKYLKHYAYSNTLTDQLFQELTTQAHLDNKLTPPMTLKIIMDTYTLKPNYPLIKINRKRKLLGDLEITQEPFNPNKTELTPNSTSNDLWWVPLSIKTSLNPNFEDTLPDLWLSQNMSTRQWTLDDTNLTSDPWLMVNPLSSGYYRVIYDEDLTKLLQQQLLKNSTKFPALARAKLIDDYFTAAHAHYVPMETALAFTIYLDKETDMIVWTSTFLNIKKMYNMLRSSRKFGGFTSFFRSRVTSALQKISPDPLTPSKGSEAVLRTHLLDWACNLEFIGCTNLSKRLLKLWMTSDLHLPNPIPIDIQPVIYCTAVATSSDEKIWNFIWDKYQQAEGKDKFKLISALCCTKDVKLLNFLIEEALNTTKSRISKSDASIALQRLAANSLGSELVFSKIKNDFQNIMNSFGVEPIAYALSSLSIYWNRENQLEELNKFIKDNSSQFGKFGKLVQSSIKIVEDNIQWMNHFEPRVSSWFEARVDDFNHI